MADDRRLRRFAVLAVAGGVVFQVTGCASGLVPVFLSFLESSVLSGFLGRFIPP